MGSSNLIVLCDSNGAVHSYIVELGIIAKKHRSFSSTTLDELKKAAILIGSRRVKRQKSDEAAKPADNGKDQDLEHTLLAPNQVAIVDNEIIHQQFGEVIFCAPQEDILEGEYGSAYPWFLCQL